MKSSLLAIAAVLGLTVGHASAYYVEILVDLNKPDKVKGSQPQGGGAAGKDGGIRPPMGGAVGFGGNAGAAGPGGAAGAGGKDGGPMPPMGFGGPGGGPRPPMGGGGSGRPPMGMGGMGMGGMGMAGMAGFAGASGGKPKEDEKPMELARVIIEAKGISVGQVGKTYFYTIDHKWGRTTILPSELVGLDVWKVSPLIKQLETKRKGLIKEGKIDKDGHLELARWALKHGMLPEFHKHMASLAKADPSDPAVVAYNKVTAAMKLKPSGNDPASKWILDNFKYEATPSDHYTLLSKGANKEEVDARLKRLEETYQNFFYWFALKGKALQVPKYRLVAVLVSDSEEFRNRHSDFNSVPMVADGFTARRDNVAVFSAKSLDPIFNKLEKFNEKALGSSSRKGLVKGSKDIPQSVELANKQVLALVERALAEEGERATVSHEGIRQLLAAAGLPAKEGSADRVTVLPRTLAGPEWIKFGMASFFETPKGAYWSGTAVPSWNYLIQFKFAVDEKKLESPEDVLEKLVTDQYFLEGEASKNKEKMELARTLAWSLAYYLANEKLEKLENYFQLLAKLPRDMKMDKALLKKTFIKAFLGNPREFKGFASGWVYFIRRQNLEVPKLYDKAQKARKEMLAAAEKAKEAKDKEKEDKGRPNGGPFNPRDGGGIKDGIRPPRGGGSGGFKPPMGPPQRE